MNCENDKHSTRHFLDFLKRTKVFYADRLTNFAVLLLKIVIAYLLGIVVAKSNKIV